MSPRQPLSGTIEIQGASYAVRGEYGPQTESAGARLAWDAEVDGLGLAAGSGVVAVAGGYLGVNHRAVLCFVQDHFQGRKRLRDFDLRIGATPKP